MAAAADSTPASDGQFALTVADLNITVNHEPRVEDIRLAEALGMERPREIRRLIERHREPLERLGAICVTVTQNTDSKGRGRPGRTFWLNKRQALYLCTKSETPRATEVTIQMVEVFDAHLAGRLAKPVAVEAHRRARPQPRAPHAETPAAFAPRLDQDGFAVMRIAGEILLVDLTRLDARPGARAVVIGWDEAVVVQDMSHARRNAKYLGDRNFVIPDPAARIGTRSVWSVGAVVASQPATAPGRSTAARPVDAASKPRRDRKTAALRRAPVPPLAPPDLGAVAVHGHA